MMRRLPSYPGKKFLIVMVSISVGIFVGVMHLSTVGLHSHFHTKHLLCKRLEILNDLKDILKITQLNSESNHRIRIVADRLKDAIRKLQSGKKEVPLVTKSSHEFCPEKFTHRANADLYFLNGSWVQDNCSNIIPLDELVTVLLFLDESPAEITALLAAIEHTHPGIKKYVAISDENFASYLNTPLGNIMSVNSSWTDGQVWNLLVAKVDTPYVLIGRDVDNFSWLTLVRRQVSIMSENFPVQVVGGSFRNLTGHWQVGCYQSSMRNYILKYEDGYYSSKNECMFCDYLLGPFVARTSIFKTISLDEKLSSVVFEDWFLRLKRAEHVTMNCPDAMYFATDPLANLKMSPIEKNVWLPLLQKWELNRIVLPDNVKISFSCEELGTDCTELKRRVGSRMLPICCMDRIVTAMRAFHEVCEKNGIIYAFMSGTLLGAVKFRDIIPWDFDGDGEYCASGTSVLLEWNEKQLKSGQVVFLNTTDDEPRPPGFFKLFSPDMFVEMWAINQSAADVVMPEVFSQVPTKMRIHGVWFYGPPSPGLRARNEYGVEILKHANSWFNTGNKHWADPYTVQKEFLPCKDPDDHACARHYATDGSLQFVTP